MDVINDFGRRTRSQSTSEARNTPTTESELLELLPLLALNYRSITTSKRLIQFKDNVEEGPRIRLSRSTRSVALNRLINTPIPLTPIRSKANNKRTTST